MSKRKLLMILSLVLLLGVVCHLYYLQEQGLLQERVRVDVIKEEGKELIYADPYLQEEAIDSKRRSKVRFILNIIWSFLMIVIIVIRIRQSLAWASLVGLGFMDTVFRVIYEILIFPFSAIIAWFPIVIDLDTWRSPAGHELLVIYLFNVLLVIWYVWIAANCIGMLLRPSEKGTVATEKETDGKSSFEEHLEQQHEQEYNEIFGTQ